MSSETIFTRDERGHLIARPLTPEARLEELERRVAALEREVAKLPDAAAAQVSRELSGIVTTLREDRG